MTISLKTIIAMLQSVDKDKYVANSLGNLHSFRGEPKDLGVSICSGCTVEKMLEDFLWAVNSEFTGYKDGKFVMTLDTKVHFSIVGTMDEYPEWFFAFTESLYS